MDAQALIVAVLGVFVLLSLVAGIVVLIICVKLYKMHDVRNEGGQYVWYFPSKWSDLQKQINDTQEKIAVTMAELSNNNKQVSQLLESLVNAMLSLHQRTIDGKHG